MAKFDTLVGLITFAAVIGVIFVLYKAFIANRPSAGSGVTNNTPSTYNAGSLGPSTPNYDPIVGETNK